MGNCSNLCSRIILPNSDVPVNAPSYKQNNNNIAKYSKEPLISKIIYIQSRVRYFFRKKKKSTKYKKFNTNSNTKTKTNTNVNNSNNYSKAKSLKKPGTEDNNYQKKRTSKKINETKKKITIGEDGMNFPQVKPMFKRNKFFSEDPFSKPNKEASNVMDQWIIREENMIK